MKLIIADDETPKLSNVEAAVRALFEATDLEIRTSRSVRATIAMLLSWPADLLILDMSLPTFDVSQDEPGGRPQGFGGMEVLRHMDFHEIAVPTIVVTQYDAFLEAGKPVDLSVLSARMKVEHPSTFVDCVYYAPMRDTWRGKLQSTIDACLKGVSR